MMNEIERRLSDGLAREAATINPATINPATINHGRDSGNRSRERRRRASATWLAAAAAVAVIAVGITFAVHGAVVAPAASAPSPVVSGTERPSTATQSPGSSPAGKTCDGGWTAFPSQIIHTGETALPAGTSAILRFAGGTPPHASLCALIVVAGSTSGGSGTVSDGSTLGYLMVMTGEQSYLIGAFDKLAGSITFTARQLDWTLTINASTVGITDLGHGWHGYVILTPARTADVDVVAKAADGSALASRQLSFGGGSVGPESPAPSSSSTR